MRHLRVVLATLCLLARREVVAQPPGHFTPQQLQEDLETLRTRLPAMHPAPFKHITQQAWDSAVRNVELHVTTMDPTQFMMELVRLAALIGDGHTSLTPPFQFQQLLPVTPWQFDEGVFVTAAPHERTDLIGARILAIDGTPIDAAWNRMKPFISADNTQEYAYTIPDLLSSATYLQAAGLMPHDSTVTLQVVDASGVQHGARVPVLGWDDFRKVRFHSADRGLPDTVSAANNVLMANAVALPHVLKGERYWVERLTPPNVLYFFYGTSNDQKNRPTVHQVTDSILALVDSGSASRLIVDLRQNGGGEPALLRPLIDGIRARPALNQTCHIAVLVNRRTFSAAATNTAQFRRETRALLVGEPPRSSPNIASEGRDLVLPNTHAPVTVSTQIVNRWPELGDDAFFPIDVRVPNRFADYVAGRDAGLDSALAMVGCQR